MPDTPDFMPSSRSRRRPVSARGTLLLLLLTASVAAACGSAAESAPARVAALDATGTDSAVTAALAAAARRDSAVRAALDALAEGRPFIATRRLQPALRDAARRTPEVELLAARAAARWQGWRDVRAALGDAAWLDARFGGEGRELLARAALGLEADSAAAAEARRAVAAAAGDSARGVRLALLARALDRLEERADAADAYRGAAALLPQAGEWLQLRAAGVTADSAERAALYRELTQPAVRARTGPTEALARRRAGDTLGAARAYAALGDQSTALSLRLAAGDSAQRAAVRREALAVVKQGGREAPATAALLDDALDGLAPDERLIVARALARGGRSAAAARAFAAAGGALTSGVDRMAYGDALFAARRYDDAARVYAGVPGDHPRKGEALYDEARAQLRGGSLAASRATLRRVLAEHPASARAPAALYLLADLATDENRDAAARSAFLDLVARYPASSYAPRAAFQAALIAYIDGDHRTAARELDALVARWPSSDESSRARYWAGRALAAAGDGAAARERWAQVAARDPRSYYATRARARLGAEPWTPPGGAVAADVPADVRAARARVHLLESLGMDFEAGLEVAALADGADASLARALAVGDVLLELEQPSRAIRVGTRALALGGDSVRHTFTLLYPVVHDDVIAAEAARHELDPALVAALIRQESNFQPTARSGADARGLMQLLPRVGRQVARGLDYPVWDEALLYQPDVNVQLGTAHLADLVRQRPAIEHVLAAYNAGGSPVARWLDKRGAADPELFTERISYQETRDYVRIVLRNREMYAGIYDRF